MSIPEQEEAKKTAREKADSTASNHILLGTKPHIARHQTTYCTASNHILHGTKPQIAEEGTQTALLRMRLFCACKCISLRLFAAKPLSFCGGLVAGKPTPMHLHLQTLCKAKLTASCAHSTACWSQLCLWQYLVCLGAGYKLMPSSCSYPAVIMQSSCSHRAVIVQSSVIMQSSRSQHAVIMQSSRSYCGVTMQSSHSHCAIIMQSPAQKYLFACGTITTSAVKSCDILAGNGGRGGDTYSIGGDTYISGGDTCTYDTRRMKAEIAMVPTGRRAKRHLWRAEARCGGHVHADALSGS